MGEQQTSSNRFITLRRLKWAGLAVCAALLVVIVGSCFVEYKHYWIGPQYIRGAGLSGGGIWFMELKGELADNPLLLSFVDSGLKRSDRVSLVWWFQFTQVQAQTGWSASGPLWPLLVLTALPTAWLWRADRRAKPWQCAKCRYDLRGLNGAAFGENGAVCPECGSKRTSTCETAT